MTVWQIWWIALAVKTILLPIIPITPDEAYYFTWSQHPQLSYFDHPPFIAWIMTVAQPLWKTAVGIRWPGVIFSHLGYIPWLWILNKLGFSHRAQIFWLLGLLLGPLVGLGGFVITPDVPLVFFWSFGVWALLRAVEKPSSPRWILLGIFVGLGLLSKYVMILFIPAALIWLAWEKKLHLLKHWSLPIAALCSIAVFSPVLIWNYQNHFVSFLFQTNHGLGGNHFKWGWPIEYLSSQLALLNPFLSIAAIYAVYTKPRQHKILIVFAAVPFAFFFLTSFRARVEANWPVCAYPAAIALFASLIDREKIGTKWQKWSEAGIIISTVFCLLIISHTVHPWIPIPKGKDHTEITREWLIDVDAASKYHPLYARSYQMAAFHSYYRPADMPVFKLAGFNRKDVYDFLPESTPTKPGYVIMKGDDQFSEDITNKFIIKNPVPLPSQLVVYEIIPK